MGKKTYRVREGFVVRDDDSVTKGGDTVELDEEGYAAHAHKLEDLTPPTGKGKQDGPAA